MEGFEEVLKQINRFHVVWHVFSISELISGVWHIVYLIGSYSSKYSNLLFFPLITHSDTNKLANLAIRIHNHISFWDFIALENRIYLFFLYYLLMIALFAAAGIQRRFLFNPKYMYCFRVMLEVFASFMIVVTIQVSYPVIRSYINGELDVKYVILYVFAVILGLYVFTSYHFYVGQSIYLPVNFFAVWDTWNLFIKYVPPSLIPLCLLINDTKIRNITYITTVVILTLYNLYLDMKLPFVSRVATVAYLIISLCVIDLSVAVSLTLYFDLSFGTLLLIFIPSALFLSVKSISLYNFSSGKYDEYLEARYGEEVDELTGLPLRFLDDIKIIDGLRYLASNNAKKAVNMAYFLLMNTKVKRIRIEAIRILIILNQINDDVAMLILNLKREDVPWYMVQCLFDCQFEAILHFTKTIDFSSVFRKYSMIEDKVKQTIITVIDQILDEDFDGCYNKMIDYAKSCNELEFFLKKAFVVMTFSPNFYDRVSYYYEKLRGDSIMGDISRYKSLIIQEENKKAKRIRALNQQQDLVHFVSYRSRITLLKPVNLKQNSKQEIQEMINSIESKSIKKASNYYKVLIYILITFVVYLFFTETLAQKNQVHLLIVHKILTCKMIALYKTSVSMAEMITQRENISLNYDSTFFDHENLRDLLGKVSSYFGDIEDVYMLSKLHIDKYRQMTLYEKKIQSLMHIIIKMIEKGIGYEQVDILYEYIHKVDALTEKFVSLFAEFRDNMDLVYYHICSWAPLFSILLTILMLFIIHKELNINFFEDLNKLWEILLKENKSLLERYCQRLKYNEVDDLLLDDDEIEENNISKISLSDIIEKTVKKKKIFYATTHISIFSLIVVLVIYEIFLNRIVGVNFPRNRELFMDNRLYQRLFMLATDAMMYKLKKNETNCYQNLFNNIIQVNSSCNLIIFNAERNNISRYINYFINWGKNGTKVDENFVLGVNNAFLKSKTKIFHNIQDSSQKIVDSIALIQKIDIGLILTYFSIFLVYTILYQIKKSRRFDCFASFKSIVQILPYEHITPQLNILMSFTDIKQKKTPSTQNKAILRSFPDPLMYISSDKIVQTVNLSMMSLSKANRQAFVNHYAGEFIHNFDFFLSHRSNDIIIHFNTKLNLFDETQIPIFVTAILIENKIFLIIKDMRSEIENSNRLKETKKNVENLLSRMLPRQMKIKIMGRQKLYSQVERSTIIFIGINDFLGWCKERNHNEIMELLDIIFSGFDEKIEFYSSLTKLKTINGTYMVASGLFDQKRNQEVEAIEFCLDCVKSVAEKRRKKNIFNIELNIGINTGGPIITGILGDELPVFDIWGDAVNVASRLETSCPPNFIQLSRETKELLPPEKYIFTETKVFLKGKGETVAYRIKI